MNSEILSIETSKKLAKYERIIKEQSIGIEKLRKRRTTYHNKYLKEKHKNIELMKENRRLCRHIDMWNKFYNEEFEKIKKAINYNENCLNSLLTLKRDTTLKYTEKDMINLAVTIHYEYLNILEGSDKE